MSVIIEGVPETIANLRLVEQKIQNLLTTLVDEVCKAGAKNAQKLVPVDTGALKGSIEGGITRMAKDFVEGQVGAGKADVVRGVGSFTTSSKGRNISIQPTSEYAIPVEFGRGPGARSASYYMSSTYVFLKDLAPKKAASLLRAAIKRV